MALEGRINEYRKPTFSENLAMGVPGAVTESTQGIGQLLQGMQQRKYLANMFGENVSGLNPELQKIYLANQLRQKKEEGIDKEHISNIINSMKELVGSTGPTQWVQGKLTEEGRYNQQKFNTLAVDLENIASTMVGKGVLSKPRFEFLLKNLPSANKTQAANQASLDAWEEVLKLNNEMKLPEEKGSSSGKVRFDVKNPEHKAKRDQLLKKFGGDREKTKKALMREFL